VATATRQSSGNNRLSATVPADGVPVGDTLTVSVATGTFNGATGCTDAKGNTYAVVADQNSGHGRLFVCSAHVGTALVAGDTVTATYPGFSGLSLASVNAISGSASSGQVEGSASAAGNSASPSSGAITTTTTKAVLLGAVANGSLPTFTPGTGYTVVGSVSAGTG
jgi:hypothetical protein